MQIHRCATDCFHPTARQLDLIRLVSLGVSNRGIATRLGGSAYTVRNQLSVIYLRLSVSDRASLVRRGYELGLLSIERDAEAA